MTDKERITEILKAYTKKNNISASSVILEEYAEELLANGVIVPPCKVGDTVYVIYPDPRYNWGNKELKILELKVHAFRYFNNKMTVEIRGDGNYITWDISCFGVSVFLTPEEAEKALERSKGNAWQCKSPRTL